MNGLYESPSASSPITQKEILLSRPVVIDGVTRFRSVLYVVAPLDAICQGVSLAPAATLSVQFSALDVHIRHDSDGWNQSPWAYEDESVEVDLALPIRVHRIDSEGYGKAALHRIDGEQRVETATLTVTTNHPLESEFVAGRFAVVLSQPGKQPAAHVQSAMNTAKAIKQAAKSQGETMAKAAKPKAGAKAGQGVSDGQWHEVLEALFGYTLDAIVVHGQPTSPRVTLMNPDQSASLWQWLEFAGVQTTPRSVTVTAEQLQPALERAFAARVPGEQKLVLPLLIESDAPCRVQLHAEQFAIRRQAQLLAGDEPVSLRFSSAQMETQTLPVSVPDIVPQALWLRFSLARLDEAIAGAPLAAASTLPKLGFRLQAGDHLATPVEMATAAYICGFTLPWWPLEAPSNLKLALLPDAGGLPASTALVNATLTAENIGAEWLMFRWPEIQLPAGRYWLQLAVEDGSGLWLTSAGEALVHRHGTQGVSEIIPAPQKPLYSPLQAAATPLATSGLTVRLNDQAIDLEADGAQYQARVQTLPAKPWQLQLQLDRGGLVTIKEECLWY